MVVWSAFSRVFRLYGDVVPTAFSRVLQLYGGVEPTAFSRVLQLYGGVEPTAVSRVLQLYGGVEPTAVSRVRHDKGTEPLAGGRTEARSVLFRALRAALAAVGLARIMAVLLISTSLPTVAAEITIHGHGAFCLLMPHSSFFLVLLCLGYKA